MMAGDAEHNNDEETKNQETKDMDRVTEAVQEITYDRTKLSEVCSTIVVARTYCPGNHISFQ